MPEDSTDCMVCKNKAKVDYFDFGDKANLECTRCGKFSLLGSETYNLIDRLDGQNRAKLSGWIYEQNGEASIPKLTREIVEIVTTRSLPSISERIDRFLLEVGKNQTKLNSLIDINQPHFIAATYSQNQHEVEFLLDVLAENKMVEVCESGVAFRILYDGYVAIDTLTRKKESFGKGFVAMSFDDTLNEAYTKGFQVGIMNAGYEPVRVDKSEHINRIDDEIIAQIKTADFVVADFTGHKGGVYFEAGYALGLNIPVIWTCRKDNMKDLHFDIRQYNNIGWENFEELANRLQYRLEATVGKGPKN